VPEDRLALSIFTDKAHPPTDADLADSLGGAAGAWQSLLETVRTRFAPVTATWGCTSKSTGWGLRIQGPSRTILYMAPRDGYFLASFALGERAAAAALEENLAPQILSAIRDAPRYAEGRGVRIEVRALAEIADIVRLAEIKLAH
jgi:Protein of unknown function (DUF3788)